MHQHATFRRLSRVVFRLLRSIGTRLRTRLAFAVFGTAAAAVPVACLPGCAFLESLRSPRASHGARLPSPEPTTPPAQEMSLTSDRSQLDKMRGQIPESTKRENDELALVMQLMQPGGDYMLEPSEVRKRFDRVVRGRRDANEREFRKARESFSADEKKARDEFVKKQRAERDKFMKSKPPNDKSREFLSDQERNRQAYFADITERRRYFESSMTQKRRDVDDQIRSVTSLFNQEHREYTRGFYERKNAEALKRRMREKEREQARRESARPPLSPTVGDSAAGPGGPNGDGTSDAAAAAAGLVDWSKVPAGPGTQLGVPDGE